MTHAKAPRPLRVDARQNYDAIVEAAVHEVDRLGAAASLETIAQKAGVGSATLHRRFPSRRALLQAVFAERITRLCARADELLAHADGRVALREWLLELAAYSADTRGLADTLELSVDPDPATSSCEIMLVAAATSLRDAAIDEGAITPTVTVQDLLGLVSAISLGARAHPQPGVFATRLFLLAWDGIRTERRLQA